MPLNNPPVTVIPDPLIKTTITGTNISGSQIRATQFTGSFSGSHFGDGSGLTGILATVSDTLSITTLTASNITGSDAKINVITASDVRATRLYGGGENITSLNTTVINNIFSFGSNITAINDGTNIFVDVDSTLTGLIAVTSSNITGSNIKTTTLSASNVTGSDAKFTTITASFSGSGANITTLNAENISAGTLSVARGGTGATTFTSASLLVGNNGNTFGTISPTGNSGSALVSNGTNWVAVATSSFGGGLTITNALGNRVVTSTGGTGLEGEANLTFDAVTKKLSVIGSGSIIQASQGSVDTYIGSFTEGYIADFLEIPQIKSNKNNLSLNAPVHPSDGTKYNIDISASNFVSINSLFAINSFYSQTMTADDQIISSSLGTVINVSPSAADNTYKLQNAIKSGQLLVVRNSSTSDSFFIDDANGATNTYFYQILTKFYLKPYQSIVFVASGSGELFWLQIANSTAQSGAYG